ncbi:uncharacterized protein EKO05_0000845 [Ascochyta rabiei]|uniref:uncharacterized protein n=1 Tax=Didymella rabiei TaxID=5454 RepID=UPI00220FC65F|nr:uncharacterized protein EKO05_0000845 [Ascochyta rabiei]UPX10174.1 hypothetical protein EKO05_0000845 [Ascochyta rabiei]
MGANQSQPRTISPEPYVSPEERAQAQAEMRAKQQAALDKRFAAQQRKPSPISTVDAPQSTSGSKKLSALEKLSKENVGWRNADANHEMRSWN